MTATTTIEHVTDEDGRRYYPIGDKQYWSVTTALKVLAKEGLPPWAAGLSAAAAFEELPKVIVASRTRPCGNTRSQCKQGKGDNAHDWRITCPTCPCGQCQDCMALWLTNRHIAVKSRRADEGKRTHKWIEEWVLSNGVIAPIADDIAPFVRAFLAFTKCYGLTPESWLFSEAIVINPGEEYAGTTDGIIRFEARASDEAAAIVAMLLQQPKSVCVAQGLTVDVLVDFKTKDDPPEKQVKFYDEVALQLAPYRFAPTVHIWKTMQEEPMPPTHGAMAIQLRPDMAVPRLCVADERTYQAFLWALRLYRWRVEFGTASVSSRSFKVPPEPKAPPMKRAPAKKATTARQRRAGVDPEAMLPAPEPAQPVRAVAATQSATLRSMTRLADMPPHPDSPLGDALPF